MSQISYKLEIVRELMQGRIHIRGLASRLRINAMMISRKMNELVKENVVDFMAEGKNKSFFLKDTIEARENCYLSEKYALLMTLEKYPNLRKLIDRIQKDNRIKLALLFGSYAKGIAKKDSDIDIFIETENTEIKKEYNLIDSKLSVKIGNLNKDNLLVKEIEKNHIIIKGVEDYYGKSGIFGKAP